MSYKAAIFLAFISSFFSRTLSGQLFEARLTFYSEEVRVPYDIEMDFPLPVAEKDKWGNVYARFSTCDYLPTVKSLLAYKQLRSLSDWLFYQLVVQVSNTIFPDQPEAFKSTFCGFILNQSGYDSQLFKINTVPYVHVRVDKQKPGFYILEKEKKYYANLTAYRRKEQLTASPARIAHAQNDTSRKAFSLEVNHLPRFQEPKIIEKTLSFSHDGKDYHLPVRLNSDYIAIMDEYPYADQELYFNVSLSYEAKSSLIPQLSALTQSLSKKEAIEFILSFTRTAFIYKDDREVYGKEKPMTAEQTLFYEVSDCEDRSALFYCLVKELLAVPMIVIDFETHVGVAVKLEGASGNFFNYEGHKFTYCEPTGPQNTLRIGEMWKEVSRQNARILTAYLPQG